jgi:hypothetical protein
MRNGTVLPVGEKEEGRRQDKVEERRKSVGFPQGLIRKIRELQGPIYKVKFSVDLKPKRRNAQNESWRVFQTLQHCFRAQVQKLKIYIFTHESMNKSQI